MRPNKFQVQAHLLLYIGPIGSKERPNGPIHLGYESPWISFFHGKIICSGKKKHYNFPLEYILSSTL